MLLNVAAHNVSIQNVEVSKRERHITYSVTKRTASQNVKCTLCNVHFTFVTVSILWRCTLCDVHVLKTLRFGTLILCAATFCNITVPHVTSPLCCFTLCSNILRCAHSIYVDSYREPSPTPAHPRKGMWRGGGGGPGKNKSHIFI